MPSLYQNSGSASLTAQLSAPATTDTTISLQLSGTARKVQIIPLLATLCIPAGNLAGTATITSTSDAFNGLTKPLK